MGKRRLMEKGFVDDDSNSDTVNNEMPIVWLCEGLLEYINPDEHKKLFSDILDINSSAISSTSSSKSVLITQCLEPSFGEYAEQVLERKLPYETLVSATETAGMAESVGFKFVEILRSEDFVRAYGRNTHVGFTVMVAVS